MTSAAHRENSTASFVAICAYAHAVRTGRSPHGVPVLPDLRVRDLRGRRRTWLPDPGRLRGPPVHPVGDLVHQGLQFVAELHFGECLARG